MHKAIFLDRDGVLNCSIVIDGKPSPPKSLEELKLLPGVDLAIKLFKKKGYLCIVITNQPDVARGKIDPATVESINRFLVQTLALDGCYSCYHDDHDNCECRKPKSGSIIKAAQKYSIDLNDSYMIGDRWRDIDAGHNAGCKTIFIDYNYDEKKPVGASYTVKSLLDAAKIIVSDKDEKN
jgi:D-glycero-D-manno-heptose 1,7-bisphosphate phosphatase